MSVIAIVAIGVEKQNQSFREGMMVALAWLIDHLHLDHCARLPAMAGRATISRPIV